MCQGPEAAVCLQSREEAARLEGSERSREEGPSGREVVEIRPRPAI